LPIRAARLQKHWFDIFERYAFEIGFTGEFHGKMQAKIKSLASKISFKPIFLDSKN
jgi:hypothetical protein